MKRKLLFTTMVVLGLALVFGGIALAVSRSAGRDQDQNAAAAGGTAKAKPLWHCGMHPQVIQDHPGDCPICHMALTPLGAGGASTGSSERKILHWWDPMLGASSISDRPGKSAMGMDLVPVYAESAGPDVKIDPAVVQNMGVRTATVTKGTLKKTLRTVGQVSLPEPGIHDISLRVSGWIDRLYADQEGMHVTQGAPLFEVYSPDLQVAAQELITAVSMLRSLPKDPASTVRHESQRLVDSARRKLRLWGVDEQDIDAIAQATEPPHDIVFRSPATGHIEEKMVVQGSSVEKGMKLLRVADHETMWLDVQVYEGQIPFVAPGQKAVATVAGVPGRTFEGVVTFLYPHLDHMSRTLKVRATLDNANFELKPGMYAAVEIMTEPVKDAVLSPREAVIDTGARQIAFVAEGDGRFSARKVRTGLTGDDDKVQILEGLAPGETVVTSGQFLMDVESRTLEAIQKLGATPEAADLQPSEPSIPTAPTTAPTTEMAAVENPTIQTPAATKPAEKPQTLTQAYCPMVKADWLQVGDEIQNPYMGSEMLGCGEVKKKIPATAPLSEFVASYLAVTQALDADKLDAEAVKALTDAAEKLPSKTFGPLQDATSKFAKARDVKSARAALKTLSRELLSALEKKP